MNWQFAIAIISALALFVPVILITIFRLYRYNNYLALLAYCLMTLGYNLIPLTREFVKIPASTVRNWGVINNLLDMPLMLLFLMLFSTSATHKMRMKIYLAVFIVFEIIIVGLYGLTIKAVTITMGPGLVLIFSIAFFYFIRKVKQSILQNKALGKAFIAGAITFAYGCFGIIYLMHYVIAINDIPNIYLIYYIVLTVFSSVLTTGLILENKRLKKREELMLTRKELEEFFSDQKKKIEAKENTNTKWEWKPR